MLVFFSMIIVQCFYLLYFAVKSVLKIGYLGRGLKDIGRIFLFFVLNVGRVLCFLGALIIGVLNIGLLFLVGEVFSVGLLFLLEDG